MLVTEWRKLRGPGNRRRYARPVLPGRLSIARSLRLALVGLTLVLAAVAVLGVSSLYQARQRYEDTLVKSSTLATAAANLAAAGIAEEAVLRDARGRAGATARAQAAAAYASATATAQALARGDPASVALVARQVATEDDARKLVARGNVAAASAQSGPLATARRLAAQLQARQQVRQVAARHSARSDSRKAVAIVAVAGILALVGALALVTLLVGTMRRPLDALVGATRKLAAGQLDSRVEPSGPRELQDLGAASNTMSDDLQAAQRRIDDERRRLAITIASLGDALIVTEPDAVTVATVNPRAAELVPGLALGRRTDGPDSPLPPLDSARAQEAIIEHGGRTLAVTAATMGDPDAQAHDKPPIGGVVWTVRDMSDRARLERAKTEFVATASHELRSPLTSIKGFVELLQRSPENMTERQREFVDIILRSTDRLVDLVNDLLDVARIEADRVEISRRPIDVGEAVHEVAELMGPRIAEKRQELHVRVDAALPSALADPSRVRQILANLLTNAHLYTGEAGRIEVDVESDRAWIKIAVSDNGPGMTSEQTEHVFERFYRGGDGGPTTPGTGLGLSIVKSLVDLHEGRIDVESEPGQGTTFRVLLPCALPGPESARSLTAIRGRRVLVVDDEREIAELIAGQLAPLEVQATIACSGEEALERLRAERYDAVTLDVLMPGMTGFEVLTEIRADPSLRAIPIVFVSVFSARSELAGEWVVGKPIDADELRDVLGAAVASGRSRVLVVGRDELRDILEPALSELAIEYEWETTGAAAARVCGERRFEIALVDAGIRSPQAVLQALDLRGRRLRRAVLMFNDGVTPTPPGIDRLGIEVVPVQGAATALLAALRGEGEALDGEGEALDGEGEALHGEGDG
jgi:signal transduction histidine kinase/DNA-binding response OmpR family regulator